MELGISKTYDGYAIWNKGQININGINYPSEGLITSFNNINDAITFIEKWN